MLKVHKYTFFTQHLKNNNDMNASRHTVIINRRHNNITKVRCDVLATSVTSCQDVVGSKTTQNINIYSRNTNN